MLISRLNAARAAIVLFAGLALPAYAASPSVAVGATHSLFLKESGVVTAVGLNASGQLGDTTTSPSTAGVSVSGLTEVIAVAAGSAHSLALKSDGTVWAWGANGAGQLGLGASDANAHATPVQVPGLVDIVAVAAGANHSLALSITGAVYAWGSNSDSQTGGPCGTPGVNVPSPALVHTASTGPGCVPATPLAGVVAIAAGSKFNVVLKADGTVRTWGDNAFGQLGNGTTGPDSAVPVTVSGLSGVTRVAAGGDHALALKLDTRAVAWGHNNAGQLGHNDTVDSNVPVNMLLGPFVDTKAIAAIAAGREHSVLFYQSGPVATFGNGGNGQLGRPTNDPNNPTVVPREMGGYAHAEGVFAGSTADRSFVYIAGGGLFGRFESTGDNANGELGTGSSGSPITAPVPVTVVAAVGDKMGKRTNFRTDASRSDLFWRRASSGSNVTWDYTGTTPTGFASAFLPGVGSDWTALGTADIDGDGRSDVIWVQPSTGQVLIWLMGGPGAIASTAFPGSIGASSPWQFAGAGDMDGDGRADIVWRNTGTGEVLVWYMGFDGQLDQAVSLGTVSPSTWQIAALADVNGDGIKDIIWFSPGDGQVAVWRMAPTGAFQAYFPAAVGAGSSWRIYRAGDFDGDGREDLFWRNSADGTNAIWYFRGGNLVDSADFFVGTPLAQWRLDAIGDFDGDGHDDLMWFDVTNGTTVRWLMQDRTVTPVYQSVSGVGAGWQVVQ